MEPSPLLLLFSLAGPHREMGLENTIYNPWAWTLITVLPSGEKCPLALVPSPLWAIGMFRRH